MKDILRAIESYASALKKATIWQRTHTPVGYVKGTKLHKKAQDNFIYEFYCYLRIIMDLKHTYSLEYDPGFGANRNKFPQGPACKTGRPFFRLKDKKGHIVYQVCAGTYIGTVNASTDAPDISFQIPNADLNNPTADQVKLIMDAKYHYQGTKKKTTQGSQFDQFAIVIRNLSVESADQEQIQYHNFKSFKGNCLLSNDKAYKTNSTYLEFHRITEVEDFDEGKDFNVITY